MEQMLHVTFTLYASQLTFTSGGGVIAEIKAGETARVTSLDVFSSTPGEILCRFFSSLYVQQRKIYMLFVFTPLRKREHIKQSQDRCHGVH